LEAGRERLALNLLRLGGFETYYPIIRTLKRSSAGRRFEGSVGLFSTYAFVLIESRWYSVKGGVGVSSVILGADGRPAKVGDEVIASLRAREDAGGFIVLPRQRQRPEFEKGDPVRVVNGPLQGLEGLYEGQRNCKRVLVLMSLLGCERAVNLSRSDIQRVQKA
jgi:transcription antitermination factor NusG